MIQTGTLYICSTPIGNLEDATFRLVRILSSVDLIACEDTRHTQKLLNHFEIKKPTISYHQHNQRERENYLISKLMAGEDIALVSDAGTPGISDPGNLLVQRAWEEGLNIEVIPGPSAVISALVISGLDSRAFVFEGFLPSKAAQRRKQLRALKGEIRTLVLYESPHRLTDLLADIEKEMEDREVAVVRELTKVYQEVKRGPASSVRQYYVENAPRGEITVVIAGGSEQPESKSLADILLEVVELINEGTTKKEALKIKASQYKIKKGDLYNAFVENLDANCD
ncbi:MAG: 16S rRNA (cytidine(1402)-2'-O)-methyltransferase [Ignavibacteriales bacterium]